MSPSEARQRCLAQHEWLRAMLTQTRILGLRFLAGDGVRASFVASVRGLRRAYEAHNAFELSVLEPMLRDADAWGSVRVARMIEEHGAEHEALEELLGGPAEEIALRFDDVAELVDAHMVAEERTFLSVQVLRDDIVEDRRPTS